MGARLKLTDEERLERRRAQRRESARRRYASDPEYRERILARQRAYLADPEVAQRNRDRVKAWTLALEGEQKASVRARINELKRKRRAKQRESVEFRRGESMARTATRYGITRDRYVEMLNEQGGACAICRQPETAVIFGRTANLGVDHDHACCPGKRACGKCVRGLLCGKCNTMLGGARDDPEMLRSAIAYLARSSP